MGMLHRSGLVQGGQGEDEGIGDDEQAPTDRVLGAPEDPYTRLLPASVPRRGWDPADAVRARAQADAA
ncbi:hypothetical protein ACFY5C_05225 [Streptomyces sp. NPDC012935]|uniref:hypothetical protein n=1 Tax=Streptomyces sp. NPDC012935 TaxID=3364857 RepID=UPI0036C3F1F7